MLKNDKPTYNFTAQLKQHISVERNSLQNIADFTFTSKYAKYLDKHKRRETWQETTYRSRDMHLNKFKTLLHESDLKEIEWAFEQVKDKFVIPSMRSMQFAGTPVIQHEIKIYNCGTRHIESLRAFAEFFYCLLGGVGMTAGVSKNVISRLPELATKKDKTNTVLTYSIEDTIEGWADSVEVLLMSFHKNTPFTGRKIVFDYSKIRPKGSILKTSGGKAPGPDGLIKCHKLIKEVLNNVIEHLHLEKLRSIDIYDILMHCADAVLSGGIRRAATAIIFDPDDYLMMSTKIDFKISSYRNFEQIDNFWNGFVFYNNKKIEVNLSQYEYEQMKEKHIVSWFHLEPQRARSNNSVLYLKNKVTLDEIMQAIERTREYGEPGFVLANDPYSLWNPCFEISFKPVTDDMKFGVQFCNLSSLNGAKIDTKEKFKMGVKAATIIGTLQATYTNFHYINETSKYLTEQEALLGVSITGLFDNPEILLNPEIQKEMSNYAKEVNEIWAAKLKIKPAARVTCVKPEGSSSLVLGASSGIHPHHAHKYFRRVQMNKLDNVYQYFKMFNPHATEESVWSANKTDDVVTFPVVVPKNAIVKKDLTAIDHLKYIISTQKNWVENGITKYNKKPLSHNVSATVLCEENEWDEVGKFIYENKDYITAISLLPSFGDKVYKQAPMEEVLIEDENRWNDLVNNWSDIDYTKLYEDQDNTKVQDTVACAGGACDYGLPSEKKSD